MKYVKTRARLFENDKPLQENDWILTKDVFDYNTIISNSKKDGYEIFQAHNVKEHSVIIWIEYLPEYGYANVDFSNQSHECVTIETDQVIFWAKTRKEVQDHMQLLIASNKYNL